MKGKIFLMGFVTLFIIGTLLPTSKAEDVTGASYSITQPTGTFSITSMSFNEGTITWNNGTAGFDVGYESNTYANSLLSLPDNATTQSDNTMVVTLEENLTVTAYYNWTGETLDYRSIFNDTITISPSDCRWNNTAFGFPTTNVTESDGLISVNLSQAIAQNETAVVRLVYNITVTMMSSPTVVIYYTNSTHTNGIQFTWSQDDTYSDYLIGYDFDFTMQMANYNELSNDDVNVTVEWTPPDSSNTISETVEIDSTNTTTSWTDEVGTYDIRNCKANVTQIQYNTTWQLAYDIDQWSGYGGSSRKQTIQYQVWNGTADCPTELYINVSWFQDGYDKIDTLNYDSTYGRFYAEDFHTYYHRILVYAQGDETESVEIVYWKNYEDWEFTVFPRSNIVTTVVVLVGICVGIIFVSAYFYYKD